MEDDVPVPASDDDEVHVSTPDSDDEDEDECRVCRGPAEEGRPLFSPCKCSGSIGLTHQDCLASWLAVTRGEGRCELCKVKFHFAPQYAPNAPDLLPFPEVLLGLGRRAVARWLPFLLRLTFCMSLWLLVAPLLTAHLYLIWMNRTISCVLERWTWQLLPADTVSGAVLAAMILISFLSLMSFADFLRVEWQQQNQQQQQQQAPLQPGGARFFRRERNAAGAPADDDGQPEGGIDDGLQNILNPVEQRDEPDAEPDAELHEDEAERNPAPDRPDERVQQLLWAPGEEELRREPAVAPENERNMDMDDDNPNEWGRDNNQDNEVEDRDQAQQAPPPPPPHQQDEHAPALRQRDDLNPRPERQFEANVNLDPLLQDDQVDMEINVALDELLGLRGPLTSLIRNLLWLLVFNTVYLGFFAFIPRTIGSAVYSNIFNTTAFANTMNYLPLVNAENKDMIALKAVMSDINEEGERSNTIFRLPDFVSVNLGYLFCAAVVIVVRFAWILAQKIRNSRNDGSHEQADNAGEHDGDQPRAEELDEAQRLALNAVHALDDDHDQHPRLGEGFDEPGISLWEAAGLVLDATVAVVKVGILLFLKMFLLPVLLGIWLDGSTMELFGSSARDRILYAGKDLFSFMLLHWVAGITFMLLVTVSVLQLREVAHPDLLAHLIRPQEPQPDLLGNLMHDSVLTQTKRMMLSLGIYTALLHLHVSIPVRILLGSGMTSYMPFLNLQFWHVVMPQLQVPLELLVFHLSMLALLEKYKNSIGEMQHHWLIFMAGHMGLAEYLLPQSVEKFILIGTLNVQQQGSDKINQVLYDLANHEGGVEDLVLSNLERVPASDPAVYLIGETKENGERVLRSSQAFISLPDSQPSPRNGAEEADVVERKKLLPTKTDRFCFRRQENASGEHVIQVWGQLPGKPIPRPPEGWDDLGAGGADVQGRWAWGKEKKSIIEGGVALRTRFFRPGQKRAESISLVGRFVLLLVLSWLFFTIFTLFLVAAPLAIGRILYWILRVPDKFIHSPLSGAVGSCIILPTVALGSASFMASSSQSLRFLKGWIADFRRPPIRKILVVLAAAFLWFIFSPLALGLNYELCLLKSSKWFAGDEPLYDFESIALCWTVGTVLINSWACLCSFSVFSKEFWVNIGNGMMDGPHNDENAGGDGGNGRNGDDGNAGPPWQGKYGRAARFYGVLKAVFSKWEWEVVDHVVLILECSLPMSKKLGSLLIVPSLCSLLWFWSMDFIFGLGEISGQHRLFIFRLSAASTLLVQLCLAFRKQIQHWFGAVHKTARDDRYLIGEILLNHRPEVES